MNPLDYISYPLGQFLYFIYNTLAFRSYGVAIIIFTLIVKAVLLPLSIKQYRSMSRMQELQPQIQEIQKRYKNDKERLNQELLKVYQENSVNPAGGCMPLLIQMPILISLYWVISSPLRFMFGKSLEVINTLFDKVPVAERIANMKDISVISYFSKHANEIVNLGGLLKKEELLNLNFLGFLNLGMVPTWDFNKIFGGSMALQYITLLLIPILAAVTTFISIKYSTPNTAAKNADNMASNMNSSMAFTMPLVTGFFTFNVPAGLGLYWIVSNIVQILQQMYMNKYVIKKKKEG